MPEPVFQSPQSHHATHATRRIRANRREAPGGARTDGVLIVRNVGSEGTKRRFTVLVHGDRERKRLTGVEVVVFTVLPSGKLLSLLYSYNPSVNVDERVCLFCLSRPLSKCVCTAGSRRRAGVTGDGSI